MKITAWIRLARETGMTSLSPGRIAQTWPVSKGQSFGHRCRRAGVGVILSWVVLLSAAAVSGGSQEAGAQGPPPNWHQQTFRKLFFDYHTSKEAWGLAANFDAEKWAAQLQAAHVEAVSMFAQDAQGWRYYQKGAVGSVHPDMPPGLDMLGDVLAACHKRQIKVIAYYNTFNSASLAQEHPDWRACGPDGSARGFCLRGPLLERHILPQIREITRNYAIDGLFFDGSLARPCYCQDCRQSFRRDTGLDMPASKDEPHWLDYVQWLNREFDGVRRKMLDAVHQARPGVLVSFNWAYTPRQPENPPADVDFLMCDIFPKDQLFWASYLGKYWAVSGKSFDIMNTAFLRWWGDWGFKPALALQQECAAIIANGGKTWIGFQMPPQFGAEPARMKVIGETMRFIEEREEFSREAEPVPYIAVLHSENSFYTKTPTLQLDEDPFQALHKMLMQSGLPYHRLTEAKLLPNLSRYRLVILPDQRCLSPALTESLRDYVRNGGSLIATGWTGTEDPSYKSTEKFALEDVLGVRLDGKYPYTHGYIVVTDERLKKRVLDIPQQTWGEFAEVSATTSRPLADLWDVYLRKDGDYFQSGSSPPGKPTGHPAITLNHFGKGQAAYVSGDIFGAYAVVNQWNLKNIFKNLVHVALTDRLLEMDAPDVVEVVLTKKGSQTLVHLINHNGERSLGNTDAFTEDLIPIHNIGLKLKLNRPPHGIRLMPENRKLSWKNLPDGRVSFTVPQLDIYSIVVVE